jgi:hypothetical protein
VSLAVAAVNDLRPGDLGFASIRGRAGAAILAGQTAIDIVNLLRGRRAENAGWITHAYLIVEHRGGLAAVEAMPAGARLVPLHGVDRCGSGFAYARLPLTGEQILAVTAAAVSAVGTRYSFADYAALAALHAGLPHALLRRYVSGSGRMICSQLCDWALCTAGVHLFDDGRLSQDVTPGALWWRAARLGTVSVG